MLPAFVRNLVQRAIPVAASTAPGHVVEPIQPAPSVHDLAYCVNGRVGFRRITAQTVCLGPKLRDGGGQVPGIAAYQQDAATGADTGSCRGPAQTGRSAYDEDGLVLKYGYGHE